MPSAIFISMAIFPIRTCIYLSSEHGFLGMFPLGERRYRMIASNPISQPSADTLPSLSELQQLYDQRSHIPVRLRDLAWSSWFHINSRMITHLRSGRVFFGGGLRAHSQSRRRPGDEHRHPGH